MIVRDDSRYAKADLVCTKNSMWIGLILDPREDDRHPSFLVLYHNTPTFVGKVASGRIYGSRTVLVRQR